MKVRRTVSDEGDGGWVTVWLLGLCLMVLLLGGIALDLWRAVGDRRMLASMADAAAIAGASGLDADAWRAEGLARLDPDLATGRALAALALQPGADRLSSLPAVDVAADGSAIRVELFAEVEFTLLRILAADQGPFMVRVVAVSAPEVRP